MKKGDEIMTKAKKKRGKKEDDNRVLDWKLKPTKRKNAALPKQKKGDEEAKQSIYIYVYLVFIHSKQPFSNPVHILIQLNRIRSN